MELRTDDDIYRARLVYLGPPGYPLPIQLPYAEWLLFAALVSGFIAAAYLLTGGSWMGTGPAIGLAILMTSLIWKKVDQDRPARTVILVALKDWRRIKPRTPDLPRITASHIRFSELPKDAR